MVNYIKKIFRDIIFLLVIAVFTYNLVDTITELYHNFWCCIVEKKLYAITVLIGIVLLLGLFYFITKKVVRYKSKLVFPVLFLIFISSALTVILNTDISLNSDPQKYFQYAIDIANKNIPFKIDNIYHQRITLYTIPIFFLFPDKLLVLQLCNIAFISLTAFLLYRIIYLTYSKKVALITFIIFLFFPIQYAVLSLPWHDNVANLYLLTFLVLLNILINWIHNNKNIIYLISIAIICAVLLFFTDTVRSTGLFIIASLSAALVFGNHYRNKKVIIAVFGIIFLVFLVKQQKANIYPENSSFKTDFGISTVIYSYNDLLSKGGFWEGNESRVQFAIPFLERDEINNYATTKYTTQIAAYPVEYLRTFFIKINSLLQISTRSRFYDETGNLINEKFHASLFEIEKYFRILIFIFAVVGLFYLIKFPVSNFSLSVFIFIGLLFIPIIFISQINPGYSYIIIPQISFWSAIGIYNVFTIKLDSFFNIKKPPITLIMSKLKLTSLAILVFLLCFILFVGGMKTYQKYSSHSLYNFDKNPVSLENANELKSQNLTQPHYSLLLEPVINSDTIELKIPIEKHKYSSFTVFLKTTALDSISVTVQNKKPDFFDVSMDLKPETAQYGKRNYYAIKHTLHRDDSSILIKLNSSSLPLDKIKSMIEIKDLLLNKSI